MVRAFRAGVEGSGRVEVLLPPAVISEERLVNKLQERDMFTPLVQKALDQAKRSHRDTLRKDGTRYLDGHVYAVAYDLLVSLERDDPDLEDIIATALLHDTVEDDPDFTLDDLYRGFPPRVALWVDLLTKPAETDDMTERDKLENNRRNVMRILQSGERGAIINKLADRWSNFESVIRVPGMTTEKLERKLDEMHEIFIPMAEEVSPMYFARFTYQLAVIEAQRVTLGI